jgi:hypothetical protein
MGILRADMEILLDLHGRGCSFRRSATLGRNWILVSPREQAKLLARSRVPVAVAKGYLGQNHEYADAFFRLLGCEDLDAIDYSDYEGAQVIQDLNVPIPEELKERYDLVYDGGTLEHIFNFPTALRNAMEMVRLGGTLVTSGPGNNQCGHGFYQLSPELYFRVFTPENGYMINAVYAIESFRGIVQGSRYRVSDPAKIGTRVGLDAGYPIQFVAVANRFERKPIFASTPYQSDYVAKWDDRSVSSALGRLSVLTSLLDQRIPRIMHILRTLRNPLRNRFFFSPDSPRSGISHRQGIEAVAGSDGLCNQVPKVVDGEAASHEKAGRLKDSEPAPVEGCERKASDEVT